MAKSNPPEYDRALSLLHAALGEFNPNQPLKQLLPHVPDFGSFEWMLTIIGLEIDLRVDIPERIADDHSRTAAAFCRTVASLPKIDTPGYTLECLGMVAQALLTLDVSSEGKSSYERQTRRAPTAGRNAKRTPKASNRAAAAAPSKRAPKATGRAATATPTLSKRAPKATDRTAGTGATKARKQKVTPSAKKSKSKKRGA
ncbi:MAG TPA: hypothetical protein VIV60_30725 [Polyangiaceae bacterium]